MTDMGVRWSRVKTPHRSLASYKYLSGQDCVTCVLAVAHLSFNIGVGGGGCPICAIYGFYPMNSPASGDAKHIRQEVYPCP